MRKVFEKRFPDAQAALAYLNSAHWDYVGRKGWFRKFDEFRGSTICQVWGDLDHREMEDAFVARLGGDGYLSVHVTYGSPLRGISNLPEHVWPSLDVYRQMQSLVLVVNEKLEEIGAGINVAFTHRPQEYIVFSNKSTEPLETVASPLLALRSEYAAKQLSEQEIEKFHLIWFHQQA